MWKKEKVFQMNKEELEKLLEDLQTLFKQEEIIGKDFNKFEDKLKNELVKRYLFALKNHSKPEQALKDSFFSINSPFAKYLFKNLTPEVGGEYSFVDYLAKDKGGEVKIEIKPLFEAKFEKSKSGETFKKIKKIKLNLREHKDQIRKYLGRKGNFVVLTNLERWYFFSKNFSLDENCNPFAEVELLDLLRDFEQIEDFWQYLDREEELSSKEPLDRKFFLSLRNWIEELREVKFSVSEEKKTEIIIRLINKFIFIQTLDCFWVIPKQYIGSKWISIEREWQTKSTLKILIKFLNEINEYFYYFYDTELFRETEENILDFIQEDNENIELLFKKLKFILGIDYGMTTVGWEKGIMQYDFRRIDEDILGKSYETYLAEVRKEEGIYYTPKYVTQYIVENTVGEMFVELLEEIEKSLDAENFDQCKKLIQKFISIKVLDPACGSGSFLIKTLRVIWRKYQELDHLLVQSRKKYNKFNGTLSRSKEDEEKSEAITELKDLSSLGNKRDLISKIVIRHIYGNDSDNNALEVAKVNIWLEAIKLAPTEFRYDKLPRDDNHILPDLEMNLCSGNSLVGLSEDKTIGLLKEEFADELKKLFGLRNQYLRNPIEEKSIEEIVEIKVELRKKMNEKLKIYLSENKLPPKILEQTNPFHWGLDFWYAFMDEDLELKQKKEQGFDIIIGNPPYITLTLGKKQKFFTTEELEYFKKEYPVASEYKGNTYSLFIDRCIPLLREGGFLSYIVPNTLLLNTTAKGIRSKILDNFNIVLMLNMKTKVFDLAEVGGSLVFVLKKGRTKDNTIRLAETRNIQDIVLNVLNFKTIDQQEYNASDDLKFYTEIETMGITRKIARNCLKLGEIVDFYQGIITGDDKRFLSDEKTGNMYKPIIRGRDIDRYSLKFNNIYVLFDKEKLWSNTDESFFLAQEKLINRQTGDELIAAYDDDRHYTLDSTHVQVLKDERFSLKYILGIFNSNLMNFFYRKKVQEEDRPFAQVKTVILKEIPIRNIPPEKQEPIIHLVNRMIMLKKLQHTYREFWRNYSRKCRNNYKSLKEILREDKKAIQKGSFDNIWIAEANFYPEESNKLLEAEFGGFRVLARENTDLRIYGIEDSKNVPLLEIAARTKELRDIIYLELLELFDSRTRIRTLEDILSKSVISVIQPNIWKDSGNLVGIVAKRFEEWSREHGVEVNDIITIDNEIRDIDNLIDAKIFELYELKKEEVGIILDDLGVIDDTKRDIISKFEKLSETE